MNEKCKLTKLEADVLNKSLMEFVTPAPTSHQLINNIEVISREFTGKGFYTDFKESTLLKVSDEHFEFTGGGCGAVLNAEILVGFLLFIKKGYLYSLEGYTYSDPWPSEIKSFTIDD